MAQVYIGVNRNADNNDPDTLTIGAVTGSTDIELRIDDSKGWTTQEIDYVLDLFERYVFQYLPNAGV